MFPRTQQGVGAYHGLTSACATSLVGVGLMLGVAGCTPSPTDTPRPIPSVVDVAALPSPSPAPPGVDALRQTGDLARTYDDAIGLALSSVIKTIALLLLGWLILARFVPLLRRKSDLVFELFTNSSGDPDLDKVLVGLTQLARELLAVSLSDILERFRQNQAMLGESAEYIPRGPLPTPAEAVDARLSEMVTSLKDVSPAEVKQLLPLLAVAFPARGTRVTATLQRKGDAPGLVGVTLRVADLLGNTPPELYTVWENAPNTPSASASGGLPSVASAQPAADPAGDPRVAVYRAIAEDLVRLAQFAEASEYARTALTIDSNDPHAQALLASCVSFEAQQQARHVVQAAGQRSEESGLLREAIASYDAVVDGSSVGRYARALWKVALGATGLLSELERQQLHDAGINRTDGSAALTLLGEVCFTSEVQLPEWGEALLKRAIAAGGSRAGTSLRVRQAAAAELLVTIGERLEQLADDSGAQKYLQSALAKQPDNQRAATGLARLNARLSVQADKDALALYTLGATYERARATSAAKTYYEQALMKQPSFADAQIGLARVLPLPRSLAERYLHLLTPATRSLAIRLTVREILAQEHRVPHDRRHAFFAQVLTFAGELNSSEAATYCQPFFDRAVELVSRACSWCPEWYSPHLTLAEAYVERGDYVGGYRSGSAVAAVDFRRAIRCFETARQLIENATGLRAGVPSAIVQDPLASGSPASRVRSRALTLHRIRLGKAFAWQRLGDPDAIAVARVLIDGLESNWDPTEPDAEPSMLFNHGEWHAREYESANRQGERAKAVRFIAYALVRYAGRGENEGVYNYTRTHPRLESVRDDMATLLPLVQRFVLSRPNLPAMGGEEFHNIMEHFFEHSGLPHSSAGLTGSERETPGARV